MTDERDLSSSGKKFFEVLFQNCEFHIVSSEFKGEEDFKVTVRCNLNNEREMERWKSRFEVLSHVQWVVRGGGKCTSDAAKFIYKKDYFCRLSKYRKKDESIRNKGCLASLVLRIKKDNKYTRYRDPLVRKDLRGIIKIVFQHTHPCNVPDVTKLLRPDPSVKTLFFQYFRSGMRPCEAIYYHKGLVMKRGTQYLSDSSVNPPPNWVYNVHKTWQKSGCDNGEEISSSISKTKVDDNLTINEIEEEEQADDLISSFSNSCQNMFAILHENKKNNYLMDCLRTFLEENSEINSAENLANFFLSHSRKSNAGSQLTDSNVIIKEELDFEIC
ncbi:hypothetical protein X975_10407, partial [Stegodyphus mimosarum]